MRGATQQQLHLIQVERLGQEIIRAVSASLRSGIRAAVGRHHDTGRGSGQLLSIVNKLHTALPTQSKVRQQYIYRLALHQGTRRLAVGGGIHLVIVLQRQAEGIARGLLIVHNQENRQHIAESDAGFIR